VLTSIVLEPFGRGSAFELGSWCERGACRHHPTALWFSVRAAEVARAKQICGVCPVRAECLAHALARPKLDGIWAGTTSVDRSLMRVRDGTASSGPVTSIA
jgi:hypothetical protein